MGGRSLLRPRRGGAVADATAVMLFAQAPPLEAGETGRRASIRRRRPGSAQVVLLFAAFALGVAGSAAAFVGIWKDAASGRDQARVAQAEAERQLAAAQATTRHRLTDLDAQVALLQRELTAERKAVTRAEAGQAASRDHEASLVAQLAAATRTTTQIGERLPGQLASLDETVGGLTRDSASLGSQLTGLQAYLQSSGMALDPTYLKNQVRYLIGTSQEISSEASRLQSGATAASATLKTLTRR
jgi:hypothetical protein